MIKLLSIITNALFVTITTIVRGIWLIIALFALIVFIPVQTFFSVIDLLIGKNNKNVR